MTNIKYLAIFVFVFGLMTGQIASATEAEMDEIIADLIVENREVVLSSLRKSPKQIKETKIIDVADNLRKKPETWRDILGQDKEVLLELLRYVPPAIGQQVRLFAIAWLIYVGGEDVIAKMKARNILFGPVILESSVPEPVGDIPELVINFQQFDSKDRFHASGYYGLLGNEIVTRFNTRADNVYISQSTVDYIYDIYVHELNYTMTGKSSGKNFLYEAILTGAWLVPGLGGVLTGSEKAKYPGGKEVKVIASCNASDSYDKDAVNRAVRQAISMAIDHPDDYTLEHGKICFREIGE